MLVRRGRTLPDTVGPGMRLLVCGLNPSCTPADAGVGFARPGNRFWPAALAAGLVTATATRATCCRADGVGMTDLVKRATVARRRAHDATSTATAPRASSDWCGGCSRGAVCFVGLAGYRAAVDRKAQPGEQPDAFGGVPAYVMPNTSGLNAADRPDDLDRALAAATSRRQTAWLRRTRTRHATRLDRACATFSAP